MTEMKDIARYEALLTEDHYAALDGPAAECLVHCETPAHQVSENPYDERFGYYVGAVYLADLGVWLSEYVNGERGPDTYHALHWTREELVAMARDAHVQWAREIEEERGIEGTERELEWLAPELSPEPVEEGESMAERQTTEREGYREVGIRPATGSRDEWRRGEAGDELIESVEDYRYYLETECGSDAIYDLGEDDVPDDLRRCLGGEDPDIRGRVHYEPERIFLLVYHDDSGETVLNYVGLDPAESLEPIGTGSGGGEAEHD